MKSKVQSLKAKVEREFMTGRAWFTRPSPTLLRPARSARLVSFILAVTLAVSSPATPVLLSVSDHTGAASKLQVTFKPRNNPMMGVTNIFAGGNLVTNLSGGQVLVNLEPDDYDVILGGVPKPFMISVFDTNVVLRAELLTTNVATFVYTNLIGQISSHVFAGANVGLGTNALGTPLESITVSVVGLQGGSGNLTNWAQLPTNILSSFAQTPWAKDINGGGFNLTNVANTTNSGNVQSATVNVTGQFNGSGAGLTAIPESAVTSLTGDLAAKVPTSRNISTTSPLSGGGALSGDLTLSIANAAADGSTKGAATFTAADFNDASGLISLDYVNGQKASGSLNGFLSSGDWSTFNNKVSTTRAINTSSPLSGGGDLSADRTLTIQNAAADGSTKGAASFTAADFNDASGLISLDYVNGQKASGSLNGFLSSGDWNNFNGKISSVTFAATGTGLSVAGSPGSSITLSSPSYVVTNNNANDLTQSNHLRVDKAHAFFPSNSTPSHVAVIGADNTLTNSGLGAVPINGDATATTFAQVNALASGNLLSNGNSFAVTFSNNVTADATHKFVAAHYSGQLGPAPTCVTNVACGPSSVLTLDANAKDSGFNAKLVTGPTPAAGQIFHCTFGTAYTTAPHVVWSHNSLAAGLLGGRVYSTNQTTTGFDFFSAGTSIMTANTNYEWEFIIME